MKDAASSRRLGDPWLIREPAARRRIGQTMTSIDPKRSALMSRIRAKNTTPELVVRQLLHARGFRFRLHRKDLPGNPDIVLPKHRIAVLVHGCFWHQHPSCRLASKPKTRTEYWEPKLARNVERDHEARAALTALGWRVVTIWECDVRQPEKISRLIDDILLEDTLPS